MAIGKAFHRAIMKAKRRNWNCIYVAVDWHDTISPSTYSEGASKRFLGFAEQALFKMSSNRKIKLILFTSSYNDDIRDFIDFCKEIGITWDYWNENPEIENTEYGDFSRKFYFDVLLDDKAGFEPDEDWATILRLHLDWEVE